MNTYSSHECFLVLYKYDEEHPNHITPARIWVDAYQAGFCIDLFDRIQCGAGHSALHIMKALEKEVIYAFYANLENLTE